MEDLVNLFARSEMTDQENNTSRDHPHFSLYKCEPSGSTQEERRKKYLEGQKTKNYDYAADARGLAINVLDAEEENTPEEMECDEFDAKHNRRSYKNQLMLSEWLVEVPPDLESLWFLKLCPVGKRCLVVASRGFTKVYTKSGYMINNFLSKLPGGGAYVTNAAQNVYSLLDCIYNEEEKTFYILDVMCWNSHPFFDTDTVFRFHFLHSKMEECCDVKTVSEYNDYKFLELPFFECDKETIKKAISSHLPFSPKLDGLLFYHKMTTYVCTITPLVCWLKAYMLPDLLKVDVPNKFLAEKPTSMWQHSPEAFLKNEQRREPDEKTMEYEEEN